MFLRFIRKHKYIINVHEAVGSLNGVMISVLGICLPGGREPGSQYSW